MTIEACQELLFSLALRSTALATLIYLVLKLCERRSAPFRCALLTSGMIALAILPLSWCLPRVEVAFLPDWLGTSVGPVSPDAVSAAGGSLFSIGNLLIVAWFLGIVGLALTQSAGIWQLQRWKDRSVALDSGYWHGLVREVSAALDYRGSVQLYRCPMIHSPAAAGLIRPCVFLPAEAAQWDAERLRVVLLHEMGHLKRGDLWTQWLSQSVCALYWFHPLVWMLNRTLHQTREFACDHTVLSSGTEPSQYAGHLLALAKNLSRQPDTPRLVMANGLFLAMASPHIRQSALEQRVRAILSYQSSSHLSLLLALFLALTALGASWAAATLAPVKHDEGMQWPAAPHGQESREPAVDTPAELHLRLTANPFPGNG